MPKGDSPPREFYALVRDALAHLYDHAYLENHPLAAMLNAGADDLDRVSRAQKVRRALLDCIEALKPQGKAPSEAARAYVILSYRYVDGLAMPAVARSLALSQRQAYREHEKGIKAVTRLVWDGIAPETMRAATPVLPAPSGVINLAETEVRRLQQTARPEPLDLREMLNAVIELLLPVSQGRGIRIEMHLPGARPQIVATRTLLRQALLNLLSYGLKTVHGELSIQVSPTQDGWLLEVQGAVERHVPQTPLPAPSAEADIGLAVAQSLISAQGGRFEAHCSERAWSGRIWLPASGRPTVLVIDDNADIVALFRRYLGGHDVAVVSASDGAQALRLAVELRPQLITLDVMMPDVDGWEILQRLRATNGVKDIPVVICSVLSEHELARAIGASDYITKPVSQDQFLAVVRRWLTLS